MVKKRATLVGGKTSTQDHLFTMNKGTNNFNYGLYGSVLVVGGRLDLVQFMIQKEANDWDIGMDEAPIERHQVTVQFMPNKGRIIGTRECMGPISEVIWK